MISWGKSAIRRVKFSSQHPYWELNFSNPQTMKGEDRLVLSKGACEKGKGKIPQKILWRKKQHESMNQSND